MLNSIFDIRGFTAAANSLQLNGQASIVNDRLQLTPNSSFQVGSAFYRNSLAIDASTSFATQFQFRLGDGQGTDGADGFTFMLQNSPTAERAIGGNGSSIGYVGIPGNSLAIEFDTYQGANDPNNNHIAIQRNGTLTNAVAPVTVPFDLNSNLPINAWIDYNGDTDKLDIFLSQTTVKPNAVTLSTTIDLFAALGNRAFLGFSAGTGGLWNTQTIENWQLSAGTIAPPPPPPIDTPINGNGNGLKAEYFDNQDFTNLKLTRIDPTVNFNWGGGSPDPTIGPDTFSTRWTGQILARYTDTYTFHVSGDDGVRLWVNGQQIVNAWQDQAPTTYRGTIALVAGQRYDIRLEYYENASGAVATLGWSSTKQTYEIIPQSQLFSDPIAPPPPPPPSGTPINGNGNGLKAEYFDNQDFTNLKLTRIDPTVNFNWAGGSPDPSIAPDTFSTRWTGQVLARYTETYTFQVSGDDGIRLWVNGQQIINGWQDQAPTTYRGTIALVAGQRYDIRLEYYENGGGAVATLGWSSSQQTYEIVPQSQLFSDAIAPPPPPPPVDTPVNGNGNGLKAEYFDNQDFTNPKLTRTDPTINFNWGGGSPDATIAPDTFSARWTGQLLARYTETYTFHASGDDGIRLWVNGQQIINGWQDQAPTTYRGTIALVAGQRYDIRLEYYESGGGAVATLGWSSARQTYEIIPQSQLFSNVAPPPPPPVETPINGNGNGLKAEYFDNQDFTNLKLTRTDPTVNFNWGGGSPDANIAPDTFSTRWTGQVMARYTDTYTFQVSGDDGIRLWVNGQQLINGWQNQAPTIYRGTIALVAGQRYDIRLEYYENGGGAVATLGWSSAKQTYEIIPQSQLFSDPIARFNYAEALQKSIYFYDAQRSGDLPNNFRVEWRGDSALSDGADVGRDLTGGWYDAGDTIKFSRTIGYTAAMLSWSWLETPQAFSNTGQTALFLDSLKWGTDYLLKAFTNDQAGQYEFYSQVGSMGIGNRDDHSNWVPAEVIHEVTDRPSYKITTATPSSDIAGQGAAGLASASIVFRNAGNISYADLLLSKAEKLFDFANRYRGMGVEVAPNGTIVEQNPYTDISYFDELLWSATWVHKAKLASNANYGNSYLTLAESIFNEAGAQIIRGNYENQQSWQWVDHGAEILLAELTNKTVYRQEVENTLDWWTIGYNNSRVSYTPGGLAWRYDWGPLRYSSTASLMALVYNETITDTTKQTRYRNFAERQINYILGDNPLQRSYMVGFGNNPANKPHHRTALGPWAGWANYSSTTVPRHTIYGAIVGGPDLQDRFTDDSTNFITNEVAIDYNAGLTGALAKLVQSYGGTPLANFPVPEQRDDQFFVEAALNANGANFTEIRTELNNRSAWPARVSDRLSLRYYITLEAGVNLSDLTVARTSGAGTVSLKPYRDNIAYVEVDLSGIKIFPGGVVNNQATFLEETAFRITSTKGWNAANDWSFDGLTAGLSKRPRIAVYDNGVKVYGTEP